jgi:predicted lipoprotein with Yx(FWY)xxD motif
MPGLRPLAALAFVAVTIGACSSSGSTPAPTAAPTVAPTAASSAAASSGGSGAAASAAAGNPAQMQAVTGLEAKSVGTLGNVLVASNGYTVYSFAKDVKDSGKSACTGGCIAKWPAVTVASGGAPAGTGLSGKLATITRSDDNAIQVTYNGLPLYFFSGDSKPGDGNGNYTNWAPVAP